MGRHQAEAGLCAAGRWGRNTAVGWRFVGRFVGCCEQRSNALCHCAHSLRVETLPALKKPLGENRGAYAFADALC